jgi:hypothetical protein
MKSTKWLFRFMVGVAALLGSAVAARADLLYDLRFDDGTKVKTVAPNTTYNLQLWGRISGDNDLHNDDWAYGYVSVDPDKVGAGAMYNPTGSTSVGMTGMAGFGIHVSGGNPGKQNTFYSFADNINGWGGGDGTNQNQISYFTMWVILGTAPDTGFVGGLRDASNPYSTLTAFDSQYVQVSANAAELLLATYTLETGVNVNTTGTAADMTTFTPRAHRVKSGPITWSNGISYYQDNPTLQSGSTPTGQITNFNDVHFSGVQLLAQLPPALMPGDANGDGTVDIADLSVLLSNYDKTSMTWQQGDFDGNANVDIQDLSKILTNYDKTASSSAAGIQAVPEPSMLVLVTCGFAALWIGTRRKRWPCSRKMRNPAAVPCVRIFLTRHLLSLRAR